MMILTVIKSVIFYITLGCSLGATWALTFPAHSFITMMFFIFMGFLLGKGRG